MSGNPLFDFAYREASTIAELTANLVYPSFSSDNLLFALPYREAPTIAELTPNLVCHSVNSNFNSNQNTNFRST